MSDNRSKWIKFIEVGRTTKTSIWDIRTKDTDFVLGQVRWYGPWRKYCFFPAPNTVFETTCLQDITDFVSQKTHAHKVTMNAKKIFLQ